jgi:hypothetical protein
MSLPIPGFEPQVVVSNDVVVYGFSDRQVRDLLEDRPLTTRPAWLTAEEAVASVGFADWGGMTAAFRPWISYALELSVGDLDMPLAKGQAMHVSGCTFAFLMASNNGIGKREGKPQAVWN